jgi:hypothetical protein
MVFRILKNIFKTTLLLGIGAGIGVWFAPPRARILLKQKLTVAQGHSKKFQAGANNLWTTSLQKKFVSATTSLDPRKIDRKTINAWVESGKHTVARISADAKQTEEALTKAGKVIQSAKTEYQQVGNMFGM